MSKGTLQGWVRQRASDKTLVRATLGREWFAVEHSVMHHAFALSKLTFFKTAKDKSVILHVLLRLVLVTFDSCCFFGVITKSVSAALLYMSALGKSVKHRKPALEGG